MVEKAPRLRAASTGQRRLDSRALEIAAGVAAGQKGHEDVCAERYRNIGERFDRLEKQRDDNHRDNQATLREISDEVKALRTSVLTSDGQRTGERSSRMVLKDWLIVGCSLSAAVSAVVALVIHH